jgi:hypothetical protein
MRGVEPLELMQDEQVKNADLDYLSKNNIKELLSSTLKEVLTAKPDDPIQYMIDLIGRGPESAVSDPELGIALWRKEKLVNVFAAINQVPPQLTTIHSHR